jgi:hypothetical protein
MEACGLRLQSRHNIVMHHMSSIYCSIYQNAKISQGYTRGLENFYRFLEDFAGTMGISGDLGVNFVSKFRRAG